MFVCRLFVKQAIMYNSKHIISKASYDLYASFLRIISKKAGI